MDKKPRIEWIDNAKAFCIVLIVMGHIGMPEPMAHFFSSFRVPLFFFVSGFLYHYDHLGPKAFLKRKFRTLVIPYLLFSLITYVTWFLFTNIGGVNATQVVKPILPLLGIFYSVGDGPYLIHNVPLWFITCLFMVEALYYFALAPLKGWRRWLVLLALSVLGHYYGQVSMFRLPWSLDVAFSGVVFYALGRRVQTIDVKKLIPSRSYGMLLAGVCLVASLLNGKVDMNHLKYGNYLLFYLAAFSGIGGAVYVAQSLPVNRFCSFFGRHTAPIMAFHLGAINVIHFLRFNSLTAVHVSGSMPFLVTVLDTILVFFMLTPVIHGWDRFLRMFLKAADLWMENSKCWRLYIPESKALKWSK